MYVYMHNVDVYNNNRIFCLNILCVIEVTVSAWSLRAELET